MDIALYTVAFDELKRKTFNFITTIQVDVMPAMNSHYYDVYSDTTFFVEGVYFLDKKISLRVSIVNH